MSTIHGWNFTTRASEEAKAASLGAWRTTLRLNREEDKISWTNGLVGVIVGAIVTSASILFLTRWHPKAPEMWVAVIALGFVGLGVLVVFARELVRRYKTGIRGMLLAHVYEKGAVFERTLGEVFAVAFADAKLRYVTWDEGNDERHREQLWVTLRDGTVRAVETWTEDECRQLAKLAGKLQLDETPQAIEPLRAANQPGLL